VGLRQFSRLSFGVLLPVLCFVLDHALGFHVFGPWTLPARLFVGAQLVLFLAYLVDEPYSAFVRGGMATAFAVGALFAWITGMYLLPVSLFGVLVLIGLLGLVPFGTGLVFSMAAARLVRERFHSVPRALVGGIVALLVTIGPALACRAYEVGVVKRARAELLAERSQGSQITLSAFVRLNVVRPEL
jgi:hypothetical protein